MDAPRRTSRVSAGTLGGVLAIVASIAGGMIEATGAPASDAGGVTLIIVFAAGAVALARPRQVQALALALGLVAVALVIETFGRLGMLYLPVLLVLGYGTLRSREPDVQEEIVAEQAPRPMLASEWEAQRRTRQALPDIATGETLRRAG